MKFVVFVVLAEAVLILSNFTYKRQACGYTYFSIYEHLSAVGSSDYEN